MVCLAVYWLSKPFKSLANLKMIMRKMMIVFLGKRKFDDWT
jgi:hypothetical protein